MAQGENITLENALNVDAFIACVENAGRRTPDVIRFGLTPLYLKYSDVVEAAARLEQICTQRSWDKPEYRTRSAVT